jgi:hypothetical protein
MGVVRSGGAVMDYAFAYLEGTEADCGFVPPEPEPEPGPQVPPEVWQTKPVDPRRAWEAVRAMCG